MATKHEPSEARAQPNQKLPSGHFEPNGLSRGEQSGAVRKTHDAEQGSRPEREERK